MSRLAARRRRGVRLTKSGCGFGRLEPHRPQRSASPREPPHSDHFPMGSSSPLLRWGSLSAKGPRARRPKGAGQGSARPPPPASRRRRPGQYKGHPQACARQLAGAGRGPTDSKLAYGERAGVPAQHRPQRSAAPREPPHSDHFPMGSSSPLLRWGSLSAFRIAYVSTGSLLVQGAQGPGQRSHSGRWSGRISWVVFGADPAGEGIALCT
jgi:hypothetical protein